MAEGIRKLLIANRGEIAVRIIHAARGLGIRTVQVVSEADQDMLAARMADEVMVIGPPAAAKSYLNIPAVLDALRQSGADALHPGYGFLFRERRLRAAGCGCRIGSSVLMPTRSNGWATR